jgi:hypothetical protein
MNTNRFYTIVVVITIVAALLTACNPAEMVNIAVQAAPDTSTTAISVSMHPRIEGCSISARQILINTVRGEIAANQNQPIGISTNDWLDSKMLDFPCIAEK